MWLAATNASTEPGRSGSELAPRDETTRYMYSAATVRVEKRSCARAGLIESLASRFLSVIRPRVLIAPVASWMTTTITNADSKARPAMRYAASRSDMVGVGGLARRYVAMLLRARSTFMRAL